MDTTIVVHVDGEPRLPQRLDGAARPARTFEAHLVGSAATGVSRDAFLASEDNGALPVPVDSTRAPLAPVAGRMRGQAGLSREERGIEDGVRRALVPRSRYADLLVVGRARSPAARARGLSAMPACLAPHAPQPVPGTPHGPVPVRLGDTVPVGWNGGIEACRATMPQRIAH